MLHNDHKSPRESSVEPRTPNIPELMDLESDSIGPNSPKTFSNQPSFRKVGARTASVSGPSTQLSNEDLSILQLELQRASASATGTVEDEDEGAADPRPDSTSMSRCSEKTQIRVPKRWTISIRNTLVIFTFFIVVITAVVTGLPTFITADRTTKELLVDSHHAVTASAKAQIASYFRFVPTTFLTMATAMSHMPDDFTKIAELLCATVDNKPTTTNFIHFNNGSFLACQNATAHVRSNVPTGSYRLLHHKQDLSSNILQETHLRVVRNSDGETTSYLANTSTEPTTKPFEPTSRPWFDNLNTTTGWSEMYENHDPVTVTVTFGGPSRLGDGSRVLIGIDVTTIEMRAALQEALGTIDSHQQVVAFDANQSQVFAHINFGSDGAAAAKAEEFFDKQDGFRDDDKTLSTSFSIIDAYSLNINVVVLSDRGVALQRWTSDLQIIIIIFLLTTLVNFMLCYFLGTALFATPLERLSAAMIRQSVLASAEGEDPHSRVKELFYAEIAFNFLCRETQQLKSFVPFAVSSDEASEMYTRETLSSMPHSSVRPQSSQLLTVSSVNDISSTPESNPLNSRSASRSNSQMPQGKLLRSVRLNTSRSLHYGHATVLSLATTGFHEALSGMVASLEYYSMQVSTVVESIVKIATRYRGNIDLFYGDIFVISFNTLHKQAQHKKAAVRCAIAIHELLANNTQRVTAKGACAGISSGTAVYGNVGTDDIARFSVIGDASRQASALMTRCEAFYRKGKEYEHHGISTIQLSGSPQEGVTPEAALAEVKKHNTYCCLVTEPVLNDIVGEMYYQRLGDVLLPTYSSEILTKRQEVAAVMADPLAAAEPSEEWMYLLRKVQAEDPYNKLNEILIEISREGLPARNADSLLKQIPDTWKWPLVAARYTEIVRESDERLKRSALSSVEDI